MTFSRNTASARAISSMVWPGIGSGSETNEITGMPGFHGNADFAVGLESADTRTVTGAGINHHEGPPHEINLDARRRR